ncbi:hypothetical protein BFC22_04210 [Carnobacterium divergens]|uniref:Uncharacterized protein n=1 Tax=Carnobacterium divergens DSM 20623 TaxID=1449336 RepID=A0A0R2I7J5_CARDV|nr:hypothetical protein [Carnobacterium divergens]ANZ99354.1 hypothetical protein BFC22_04210 [Carnobacterium divergens]KRN57277.1 hypothetical protein IV74_GL000258 [Carnobacterium divergens DSM 20623]MDO0875401.1 hypothetical protein [Carnobacterium divergens]SUX16966.1 Uncharacterised protein [Carnobacterium divergens]
MGLIDKYWNDDVIYYIEFMTINDLKVSKVLALNVEYSLDEVKKIILEKFYNVKYIKCIDVWEECLSLKFR